MDVGFALPVCAWISGGMVLKKGWVGDRDGGGKYRVWIWWVGKGNVLSEFWMIKNWK